MYRRHAARLFALLVLGLVVFQWALVAQTPAGQKPAAQKPAAQKPSAQALPEKRLLSYDVVDSWRSIQGTRLSNDGQWLAYATTSQAEDGELVVRNVKTGQEFKHPRGTGPTFSSDGAFVCIHDPTLDRTTDGRGSLSEWRRRGIAGAHPHGQADPT